MKILLLGKNGQVGCELQRLLAVPIQTTDYATPATRPLNSRLATGKFTAAFHLTIPRWCEGVARMIDEGPN
jgi:dTDP-4-dehydrorhamnose reductase